MSQVGKIPRVFRIVVAAAIVKNKSVLLLKRRSDEEAFPGVWEFPSGKRKFGESSIEALMREVMEETGLSIVVDRPIYVFEYTVEKLNEIRDVTQINFVAYLSNPNQEVKINKKEHEDARWFTKDEIISLENITKEVRGCAIMVLESFC